MNPARDELPFPLGITGPIVIALALALASCSATQSARNPQDARDAERFFLQGEALAEQGRAHEAIDAYHAAIRAAPNFAMAYYDLGNQYARLGRFEPAIASYKRAIQKDSSSRAGGSGGSVGSGEWNSRSIA